MKFLLQVEVEANDVIEAIEKGKPKDGNIIAVNPRPGPVGGVRQVAPGTPSAGRVDVFGNRTA